MLSAIRNFELYTLQPHVVHRHTMIPSHVRWHNLLAAHAHLIADDD